MNFNVSLITGFLNSTSGSLNLPLSKLSHLVTSMSVRMRIVVIALVPLLGFLANGIAFTS